MRDSDDMCESWHAFQKRLSCIILETVQYKYSVEIDAYAVFGATQEQKETLSSRGKVSGGQLEARAKSVNSFGALSQNNLSEEQFIRGYLTVDNLHLNLCIVLYSTRPTNDIRTSVLKMPHFSHFTSYASHITQGRIVFVFRFRFTWLYVCASCALSIAM